MNGYAGLSLVEWLLVSIYGIDNSTTTLASLHQPEAVNIAYAAEWLKLHHTGATPLLNLPRRPFMCLHDVSKEGYKAHPMKTFDYTSTKGGMCVECVCEDEV